ncbi:MAG: hypothetical protein HZA18_03925 [Nitrospirae bacterium]|nr:hypothetical protein [Nitrospirota bacterium]
MKKFTKILSALSVISMLSAATVHATPSTTYWTPATMDVQPYGVWHITYDSYFTIARNATKRGDFPTDVGLTVGVLPYQKINLEVGFDWLEPSDDPLLLNAKFGTPEGSLFPGSPALNLGIFNVGTDTDKNDGDGRTDQNIVHVMVGKTIPMIGRLHAGYYIGNKKALNEVVDGTLDTDAGENDGFMIGYDRGFFPAKDADGEYNKWVFAADYASGKNALGGGGFGIYHYFTRNIDLLTGPVWFNEKDINGVWKWTLQLDVNF